MDVVRTTVPYCDYTAVRYKYSILGVLIAHHQTVNTSLHFSATSFYVYKISVLIYITNLCHVLKKNKSSFVLIFIYR